MNEADILKMERSLQRAHLQSVPIPNRDRLVDLIKVIRDISTRGIEEADWCPVCQRHGDSCELRT